MSVDSTGAEKALSYLRQTAVAMEDLVWEARDAARLVKLKHALAIERMGNANTPEKVPATLRKEIAWADLEVDEAVKTQNKADAVLIGTNAKCDAAKQTISIYQTMVKDRS
jgi:hypothetical protein